MERSLGLQGATLVPLNSCEYLTIEEEGELWKAETCTHSRGGREQSNRQPSTENAWVDTAHIMSRPPARQPCRGGLGTPSLQTPTEDLRGAVPHSAAGLNWGNLDRGPSNSRVGSFAQSGTGRASVSHVRLELGGQASLSSAPALPRKLKPREVK